MPNDIANVILFRSRFKDGGDFPADRKIYPLYNGDEKPANWIGNLGIDSNGVVIIEKRTDSPFCWYGFDKDVAYVDNGRNVPGRGLRVVDAPFS